MHFVDQAVRTAVESVTQPDEELLGVWDSLYQLRAIVAVERLFSIVFDTGEVAQLNTLAALTSATIAKLRRTTPKKLVITDLDGTLWSGVLGEEGVNGLLVTLEQTAIHGKLRQLRQQGVLLAVCSHNNESEALLAMRVHALPASDFVASRINWEHKAKGVAEIAKALNVGLDAVVFMDDSPHERALVATAHPLVTVISPCWKELNELNYSAAGTEEDSQRTAMLQADQQRQTAQQGVAHETYLRSLETVVTVEPLGPDNVARAAQLCQRTNQYNLTMSRYDEDHLKRCFLAVNAGWYVGIVVSVRDRFGDAGRVGFALANATSSLPSERWSLETLVLSCRVIGRGIETAMLAEVVSQVAKQGGKRLRGYYVPGPRNAPCSTFLTEHGFVGGCRDASPVQTPDWLTIQKKNPAG